jgi:hypothetical protein
MLNHQPPSSAWPSEKAWLKTAREFDHGKYPDVSKRGGQERRRQDLDQRYPHHTPATTNAVAGTLVIYVGGNCKQILCRDRPRARGCTRCRKTRTDGREGLECPTGRQEHIQGRRWSAEHGTEGRTVHPARLPRGCAPGYRGRWRVQAEPDGECYRWSSGGPAGRRRAGFDASAPVGYGFRGIGDSSVDGNGSTSSSYFETSGSPRQLERVNKIHSIDTMWLSVQQRHQTSDVKIPCTFTSTSYLVLTGNHCNYPNSVNRIRCIQKPMCHSPSIMRMNGAWKSQYEHECNNSEPQIWFRWYHYCR